MYCLGDIVGYGAEPDRVVDRLREEGAVALLGNHDAAVLSGDTSWFNPRAAEAVRWTSEHLSQRNREFLERLPQEMRIEFSGVPTYLTHGSPDDHLREYVEPETRANRFGEYLGRLGVRAIGLGHTHRPFVRRGERGVVFNPGSVGQPRDGDPRAGFAFVAFENGRAEVSLRRVEYDVEKAAAKIRDAGLPEPLAARLFEGW